MKSFCIIIFTIIFCHHANAQLNNEVKYIWQNEFSKINASVQIYKNSSKPTKGSIYFITNVDTIFNSHSDSIFKQFISSSSLQYDVIKISFYDLYDSSKLTLFANELINNILPDINKRYKNVIKKNAILSGVNGYALVALQAAIQYSNTIEKTAVFFNEYLPNKEVCKQLAAASKLMKGKLFMYVNVKEDENLVADELAESLALYSTIILYKYDDENGLASKYIFTEAYNWLMADGNNYILKSED